MEPQLITNVSGPNREKRRIVKFDDIPKVVVNAVTSAEDKRFFQHSGFDPIGIVSAAYVDLKEGRKEQGASTLSQQLARMFWLDNQKRWTRKLAEVIITLQIEQKLSKAGDLRGLRQPDLPGFPRHVPHPRLRRGGRGLPGQGLEPDHHCRKPPNWPACRVGRRTSTPSATPITCERRRNVVLGLMRAEWVSGRSRIRAGDGTPLTVASGAAQSLDAPYFVDMVDDAIQSRFQDTDFQSHAYRIYTTLDLRLQREASEAIRLGMQQVDAQIKKQRASRDRRRQSPRLRW